MRWQEELYFVRCADRMLVWTAHYPDMEQAEEACIDLEGVSVVYLVVSGPHPVFNFLSLHQGVVVWV